MVRFSEAKRSRHSEIPLDSGRQNRWVGSHGDKIDEGQLLRQKLPFIWMQTCRRPQREKLDVG